MKIEGKYGISTSKMDKIDFLSDSEHLANDYDVVDAFMLSLGVSLKVT